MQMRLIDKHNKNKTSRGGPRRPLQEMATPHQCACCRRPLGWRQRMLSVPRQFPQHSNITNTHFLTIDWSSFPHIHITSVLVLNSLKSLTCQNRLSHIRVYGSILYAVDGLYMILSSFTLNFLRRSCGSSHFAAKTLRPFAWLLRFSTSDQIGIEYNEPLI